MSRERFSLRQFVIACTILVPLFVIIPHESFGATLLLAVVGIGAARLIEALLKRRDPVRPALEDSADRRWEVRVLLNSALRVEGEGDRDGALALFEEVVRKGEGLDEAEVARRHADQIRDSR
jgi:hypothetical protein